MSKQTYEDIVKKTAEQAIEGSKGMRISDKVNFFPHRGDNVPNSAFYTLSVYVDSYVHTDEASQTKYDVLDIYGHRLAKIMDLMKDLGFKLGSISQFDKIELCTVDEDGTDHTCDRDDRPRGLRMHFSNSQDD